MKYGFIGTGNMGGAIAAALSQSTKEILLANRTAEKAEELAKELGVLKATNEEIAKTCDCIFLGVKPQTAKEALAPLAAVLLERKPILVTMLAGVTIDQIQKILEEEVKMGFRPMTNAENHGSQCSAEKCCETQSSAADNAGEAAANASCKQTSGDKLPVIRIMPNTPVAVGRGVVLYCCSDNVPEDAKETFLKDMAAAGVLDELPEHLIDAGCAISGCGPAFMYMYINALADGAVACGLPREKALLYAEMTMLGSAELALASGAHPEQLKDAVCSPGGATIMGVAALEEAGLRDAGMTAVRAAYERTIELGQNH